jgi:hypothetical protein
MRPNLSAHDRRRRLIRRLMNTGGGGAASPTLAALTLSASTVAEGTASGVTVGAVQGVTSGSTLSLVDDAGGRFALSGGNLITGLVETDYETATSHEVTIRETHADGNNSPRDTVIEITVEAATGIPATDYTITNDAEFTALKALGGATLSGKSVLIDGDLGVMTFNALSMASPLTFYMTPGRTVGGVIFDGNVSKTIWHGVFFQGTGWTGGNVGRFASGVQDPHEFHGCTTRHGYTAALLDTPIDDRASIPEIQKPQSSGTATTTSSRIALPAWNNDALSGGETKVQNNGAQTVYVKLGDGTVTGDTSITNDDTARTWIIAPGAGHTFDNLPSPHPTHLAVITATGTSDVTVDMQQGLSHFQRDGWTEGGGVTWPNGGPKFFGCTFLDLNNGARLKLGVVMDCHFERIYQDLTAGASAGAVGSYFMRNTYRVPWSTAADAQNPHGDVNQQSGQTVSAPRENCFFAGNVLLIDADAADNCQGFFHSDYNWNPNYVDFTYIANIMVNTPGHALAVGEGDTGEFAKDILVVGNTLIGSSLNINTDVPLEIACDTNYAYAAWNIAGKLATQFSQELVDSENYYMQDTIGARSAILPNFADIATATTKAEMIAAVTPAGDAAGLGISKDLIDWTTSDPAQVIKWQNVPSGAGWKPSLLVATGSVITTPLARILNRRAAQTVVPGSGVEWRKVATDGTTELQAWTSSSGTIEWHEYIQIRYTAAGSPASNGSATITINGIAQVHKHTTASNVPSVNWTVASGSPRTFIKDPANLAAGTTRLDINLKFFMPTAPSAAFALIGQSTTALKFEVTTARKLTVQVKDSATNAVFTAAKTLKDSLGADVVLPIADWIDFSAVINHATGFVTVTINGVTHPALPFDTPGTGSQRSGTPIMLGSEATSGTVVWPAGTQVADVSIYRNGALHVSLPSDATSFNANSWQAGADAT